MEDWLKVIFSGVGVLFFSGVGWAINRWLIKPKTKPPEPPPIEPSYNGPYFTTPTADDICRAMDDAPPYQRKDVEKSFVGLNVDWTLRFFSIGSESKRKGKVELVLFPTGYKYQILVAAPVDLDRFPILKVTKAQTHMRVLGRIVKCTRSGIELDDVSLDFTPQPEALPEPSTSNLVQCCRCKEMVPGWFVEWMEEDPICWREFTSVPYPLEGETKEQYEAHRNRWLGRRS